MHDIFTNHGDTPMVPYVHSTQRQPASLGRDKSNHPSSCSKLKEAGLDTIDHRLEREESNASVLNSGEDCRDGEAFRD